MTPGARVAAAIEILDEIMSGAAAEQTLTSWARRSRFAGSKDREAVRNHVFDALRNLQRFQALAGETGWPPSGRAVMIGSLYATGTDPAGLFSGDGHAPPRLTAEEMARASVATEVFNMPNWLRDRLVEALGPEEAAHQARRLSERAPVTLRANTARVTRSELEAQLRAEGFTLRANPLAPDALTVTGSGRGLTNSRAHASGFFEMQDAASQAVVAALDLPEQGRILDFCAGGGGKTLAMAAKTSAAITAHDADPARMKDLPDRAARAGVRITIEKNHAALPKGGFALVLLDVPCSGSGSWRRAPDAKWRFTPERLEALREVQRKILSKAQELVAPDGRLAYVTCSILPEENRAQSAWFVENYAEWHVQRQQAWPVSRDGDGFFLTVFSR